MLPKNVQKTINYLESFLVFLLDSIRLKSCKILHASYITFFLDWYITSMTKRLSNAISTVYLETQSNQIIGNYLYHRWLGISFFYLLKETEDFKLVVRSQQSLVNSQQSAGSSQSVVSSQQAVVSQQLEVVITFRYLKEGTELGQS